MTRRLGRRDVLRGGASVLPLIAGLGACKREPKNFSCTDETGLTDAERAVRRALQYVDRTPNPEQPCKVCTQWIEAPPRDDCGGCKVMKGPVHPEGWCKVFARKG